MNDKVDPRATVMIVDDTPANLAVLSDALEEQGYRVLVATDGFSALEQLLAQSGLAALAVDSSGRITWITDAAAALLEEQSQNGDREPSALPAALLDAVFSYRAAGPGDQPAKFFCGQLSVKISLCEQAPEYLLLLQKGSGDWNPDTLRSGLGLTLREAEVLMWISRGKTNRDIGQILGSSPRTVNKHLEHIFEKLGVGTRSAAVSVALQHIRKDGG